MSTPASGGGNPPDPRPGHPADHHPDGGPAGLPSAAPDGVEATGYGRQWGPGHDTQAGRGRTPWAFGGAAVIALVVLGLVLFFTVGGGDGPTSDTSSPRGAVTSFVDAATTGDLEAVKNVSCPSLRRDIDAHPHDYDNSGNEIVVRFTVKSTTQHGKQADVDVTLVSNMGHTESQTYQTVRDNGEWTVCNAAGTGG